MSTATSNLSEIEFRAWVERRKFVLREKTKLMNLLDDAWGPPWKNDKDLHDRVFPPWVSNSMDDVEWLSKTVTTGNAQVEEARWVLG